MLETEVEYKTEFDGTAWHLSLLDDVGGPDMSADQAGTVLWWFSNGGLQFTFGKVCDTIDKAFKEMEARNG